MSLESALKSKLSGTAELATLFSDRIFLEKASDPAPALPYLIVSVIDQAREHHLTGAAAGIGDALVQFTCVAESLNAAVTAREVIYEVLDGFQSNAGEIRSIAFESATPDTPTPQSAEAVGDCRAISTYKVWYRPAIPGE